MIPGQGAKTSYASWSKNQNIKIQKLNKLNKDLKKGAHKEILKKKKTTRQVSHLTPVVEWTTLFI